MPTTPTEDTRPDLSWARGHDLVNALNSVHPDIREPDTVVRVQSVVSYAYDPGGFKYQRTEVERRWIIVELEERRKAEHEQGLAELRRRSTRELLLYLNYARAFGGWFSPCDSSSSYGFFYDDIKAELATRPHIPGKLEAKANRQKAARNARFGKNRSSGTRQAGRR